VAQAPQTRVMQAVTKHPRVAAVAAQAKLALTHRRAVVAKVVMVLPQASQAAALPVVAVGAVVLELTLVAPTAQAGLVAAQLVAVPAPVHSPQAQPLPQQTQVVVAAAAFTEVQATTHRVVLAAQVSSFLKSLVPTRRRFQVGSPKPVAHRQAASGFTQSPQQVYPTP